MEQSSASPTIPTPFPSSSPLSPLCHHPPSHPSPRVQDQVIPDLKTVLLQHWLKLGQLWYSVDANPHKCALQRVCDGQGHHQGLHHLVQCPACHPSVMCMFDLHPCALCLGSLQSWVTKDQERSDKHVQSLHIHVKSLMPSDRQACSSLGWRGQGDTWHVTRCGLQQSLSHSDDPGDSAHQQ